MIESATENVGKVFAYDENGCDICVGAQVILDRKLYQVQKLIWSNNSGDNLYEETVHLELLNLKTRRTKIVEDCDVALVEEAQSHCH